MSIGKISLGTVQFGLDYGVLKNGQVSEHLAHEILSYCHEVGINHLDTSEAYGNSEDVIGKYILLHPGQFHIYSKFTYNEDSLTNHLNSSLTKLSVSKLQGYYYHRFSDYKEKKYLNELLQLKLKNKVHEIGVSLYTNDELKLAIQDDNIDIIQLPFNLLDNDLEKRELLLEAKAKKKKIAARSIFLQGLFQAKEAQISPQLSDIWENINELKLIAHSHQMELMPMALNYVLSQNFIDNVLIGVDSLAQLKMNVTSIKTDTISEDLKLAIENIKIKNRTLLNPVNWK